MLPFLAGLGSFLASPAGAAAQLIGKGLGGVVGAQRARDRQDTSISRLVADAQRAGIHPLAALGSPVAGAFGTPITGSSVGDALESFGRSKLERKQAQLLDAQIGAERAKERALIAEATSRSRIAGATRVATGGAGPIPLYVKYVDLDGNEMWGPNPDLPSNDQFPAPAFIHGNDAVVTGPLDSGFRWPGNVVPPDPRVERYPLPPKRPRPRPGKKITPSYRGATGWW